MLAKIVNFYFSAGKVKFTRKYCLNAYFQICSNRLIFIFALLLPLKLLDPA